MSCPGHADVEATVPCARCGVGYCDDCLVTLTNERVCAACKGELLRDVISGTTYRRVELAHLAPRFVAWLIDRLMLWALQAGAFWLAFTGRMMFTSLLTRSLLQIFINVAYLVYEGVLVAKRGQTLGKMAMRVRVVRVDGAPVAGWQAWTRAGVRFAGYLALTGVQYVRPGLATPFSLLIALIDYTPGLVTPQRTTLHDLVARTRVVREPS